MDGKTKRRKVGEKFEEVEDAEVEKFYALIRKTREVHGHLFKVEASTDRAASPAREEKRPSVVIRQPSFKLDDFGLQEKSGSIAQVAGSSRSEEPNNGRSKEGNGPNLELSL